MRIPFVDLAAQYAAHRQQFDDALANVIAKTAFIGGEFVRQFEADYRRYYGVRNCVSCANGTDAIYIALRMLGIGPGDEVITSALSWISTAEVIVQAGAQPVFVDIDEQGLLDVAQIEAKVTPRTRAVIPVHLYGQAVDMTTVSSICQRYGLKLIEDCAQAHFAEWRGQRVGTFGDAATFSFYPGKNLGAWGDAGAIVTASDELATRCRMYANHGALVKHQHEMVGINSRLDGMQAALLSAKLPFIDEWTQARRRVAAAYDAGLADVPGLSLPQAQPGSKHVYHLYVIRTGLRDRLKERLADAGVESAVHYPRALPFLPAFEYLGHSSGDFPVASRLPEELLSLPMYPELTGAMTDYVIQHVREIHQAPGTPC